MESWLTVAVRELARVILNAIDSWGRTTRLAVLLTTFVLGAAMLMLIANR
jgi:hypothetical protein